MLTQLRLKNFKTYEDKTTIEIGPLTLIYGPNSAGKSSILQGLLLLAQSVNHFNLKKPIQDLLVDNSELFYAPGSYHACISQHEKDRTLELGLSFKNGESFRHYDLHYQCHLSGDVPPKEIMRLEQFSYGKTPDSSDKQTLFSRNTFDLGNSENRAFAVKRIQELNTQSEEFSPSVWQEYSEILKNPDLEINANEQYFPYIFQTEHIELKHPDQIDVLFKEHEKLLVESVGTLTTFLNQIDYLGPFRETRSVQDLSGSTSHLTDSRGNHILREIYENPDLLERINSWLKKLGTQYEVEVKNNAEFNENERLSFGRSEQSSAEWYHLLLKDARGVLVRPEDVGFGIGQLLPILVRGCQEESSFICIEQPEIHLHPRLQAELADFFLVTSGLLGEQNLFEPKQWLIETHSEALLLRIRRRIREGKLSSGAIKIIYILSPEEMSNMETKDKIRVLRMDEDGDFIENWPSGFFEERYNELFGGNKL